MIPKLTDDAVSRLPLEGGRAALLEEIVDGAAAPSRGRRWVAPLAAAALVAGIAGSSLWWAGEDPTAPVTDPDTPVATEAESAPARYAVLDAQGWTVSGTEGGGDFSGESYENGARTFEVTTYPAETYAGYVEDREHIVDPPAPGEPVTVMGLGAQMWAYSRTDHAAIREVQDGQWMEFRGAGMDEAAYVALLGRLQLVDRADFEASLPGRFVTDDERGSAVTEMLDGITTAAQAGWPGGREETVSSQERDRYQLGANVAGAYACAWLGEYVAAGAVGDAPRAAEAVRVLGTSRQWPILAEMEADGFYPQVIWDYADEIAAGQAPEAFRDSLGCR